MSTPPIFCLRLTSLPSTPKNFFTSSLPRHPSKTKTNSIRNPQRFFSSRPPLLSPPKQAVPISATSFSSSRSRLQNRLRTLQLRLPKFLHPYTAPLLDAPKTYIISFLILHEITAIVPILLLASGFHYSGWLPSDLIPEEKVEKAKGCLRGGLAGEDGLGILRGLGWMRLMRGMGKELRTG
ncbi:uncharacterized protein EAF01_009394 [Botrytis porri]|uniref:uncharacterized protein n=1 Tax=Botrytis porri TaxID=87229 RepID=UPI0019006477|nr:uncharacterized protein EAF01_009394 [Botrytis porri]KAF7896991.1 hypothetical protein EAF01_009394 [Botrytis porri]